MKRLALAIAVVLCLVGCGPFFAVPLLTGDPLGGGCFAATGSGRLVVDPSYGTAMIGERGGGMVQLPDRPTPVAWRPGYTARRAGSELEVLDPQGRVVATTGRSYTIPGGWVGPETWRDLPTTMFWACGDPELLSSVSRAAG